MIAVSGSGIAGLAAALAVLRNQKPLLLVAGRTPATTLQGGVQIAPNGWAALDQLGLGDAARARATTLQAITVRDMRSAATLASLDLSASPYASLSRADLANLLRAEISALSGMTDIAANIAHAVQRGPDQDRAVHMLTDDGGRHDVDALIAADGVCGFGRHYVNGTDNGIDTAPNKRRVAMRAVAKTTDLPRIFSQPFCNLWLGQGAHFVHYPLHGGKDVNMVLTLDAAKAGDDWQQRYLGRNDILGQLCNHADIKWVNTALPTHPYHDCWRRGRTVLAGDAAHPIPPNLAQGAGQSLADAASLLRWMADDDLNSALSGYARERSKAVGVIFKKAAVSSKIMALDGTSATARSTLIGLGGAPMLNAWLAEVWAAA
ncbi:FAD-dependent monooxygenase [Candidatus Puniceispirillum sp.]|nr:FAD-dependent monooxygenase [Alphaproteobacteria bacterium]MDC1293442.1 FAD-dependent monooxygenase [Candidatus Puniceispirillum sp.]